MHDKPAPRPQELERLSRLPGKLRERGYDTAKLRYRAVWLDAVEGRLPALQTDDALWRFNVDDMDAIAAFYGLTRIAREVEPADVV
jgi:hypothetical protein